jgi:hypothetical protein
MSLPFVPWEAAPIPIEYESVWAEEPDWIFGEQKNLSQNDMFSSKHTV